jgi:protocatechuate 3,4-dioxygenase, alpha subunit
VSLPPTPSQTAGPFFAIGLCRRPAGEVVSGGSVRIEGRVLDGAGEPVPDSVVELWQAGADGLHRADVGWGRCGADADGRYAFTTEKPGSVDGQAPHVELLIFARGLLKPVLTRMYFPEDAHDDDPVLTGLAAEDRATLVAEHDGDVFRFDVRLQGDRQTAFFTL